MYATSPTRQYYAHTYPNGNDPNGKDWICELKPAEEWRVEDEPHCTACLQPIGTLSSANASMCDYCLTLVHRRCHVNIHKEKPHVVYVCTECRDLG